MKTLLAFFALFVIVLTVGPNTATAQTQDEYNVVVNHEEQYSVWPSNKKPPKGWKATEFSGTQAKCQDYITEVWTDMRPLSIQKMNLPVDTEYSVVVNHEEQYSIWPRKLALPKGWKPTDFHGARYPCVKYIREVWTDMRPLSMRKGRKSRKH